MAFSIPSGFHLLCPLSWDVVFVLSPVSPTINFSFRIIFSFLDHCIIQERFPAFNFQFDEHNPRLDRQTIYPNNLSASFSFFLVSLRRLLDITTTLLLGLPRLDCRAEVPVRKRGGCYGRAQISTSKKNKAIITLTFKNCK